jgi:uncharacterized protein
MATRKSRKNARAVFLDTNGWLALLNEDDTLHERAHLLWKELGTQGYSVVLTDWIIAETGNGLARTRARRQFADPVRLLLSGSRARVIFVNSQLLERALEFYEARDDKTWGLVDCASFIVMGDERILEAFTNDRHFNQAGFRRLLPSP